MTMATDAHRKGKDFDRTLFLIAFGLACFTAAAWGQRQTEAPPALLWDGERQLEEGRSTLDEQTLMAARTIFETCIQQDGNNSHCYFDLARADSYLVRVKESQNDKKAAERWLDSAIDNARRFMVFNDRSAEAHALLADLYGSKIGCGGAFDAMRYGPKANAEDQQALQLDANNPRAYAVAGRRYLYSPKMFGGDLDKAIDAFRKATALDPHGDEAFVWLAIAYRKKGDETRAQVAIAEALRLNSRSVLAKRIQSGSPD
jgi:tetratricopeptide (TPR) repeat protein